MITYVNMKTALISKSCNPRCWERWDSTLLWLHATSLEVQIRRNLVLQRLEFLGPQGPLSVENRRVDKLHKAILLDGATCGVSKISWGLASLQIEGQPIIYLQISAPRPLDQGWLKVLFMQSSCSNDVLVNVFSVFPCAVLLVENLTSLTVLFPQIKGTEMIRWDRGNTQMDIQ